MKKIGVYKNNKGEFLIKSEGFQIDDSGNIHVSTIDDRPVRIISESKTIIDNKQFSLIETLSDEELQFVIDYLHAMRINVVEFAIFKNMIMVISEYDTYHCRLENIYEYRLHSTLSYSDMENNSNAYSAFININLRYYTSQLTSGDIGKYLVFSKNDNSDDIDDCTVTLEMLFGGAFSEAAIFIYNEEKTKLMKVEKIECNQYSTSVLEALPQLISTCSYTLYYYDIRLQKTCTYSVFYYTLFHIIASQIQDITDKVKGVDNIVINL